MSTSLNIQYPIDGSRDALWMATATDAPRTTSLTGDAECDVAIVGAGFTGLNAAIELASQGVSVCVLEAKNLGFGASGRSGGQVNLGLNLLPSELIAKFGDTVGNRLVDTVLSAPDHVFGMIDRHQLRCDPVRNGWIQAAANRDHEALHNRMTVEYARHGYDFEALDHEELYRRTGSSRYQSGLLCPTAGSIQPLSYTRELARVALSLGASVYTDSAINGIDQQADGWLLRTSNNGLIKSQRVLICTNGYTGPLVNNLSKKVVPVRSILIASEPLPPHLQAVILPQQVTLVDKRRLILYMRYDRDGRLCIGDHGPMRDAFNLSDFDAVKKRALEVFPQLANTRWDYHWGGRVAMTQSRIPFLHRIAPGLTAAMGYNGRGVGMGSLMGKVAANTIMSRDDDASGFPVTSPRNFMLHRFHGAGVNLSIKWFALLDHLDAMQRQG